MKKTLLTGIAALFLATGAVIGPSSARAAMPLSEWAVGGCDAIGTQVGIPPLHVLDWRKTCTEFRATLDTSPENLESNVWLCTMAMLGTRNRVNGKPDFDEKAPKNVRLRILQGCYMLVGDLHTQEAMEAAKKHVAE